MRCERSRGLLSLRVMSHQGVLGLEGFVKKERGGRSVMGFEGCVTCKRRKENWGCEAHGAQEVLYCVWV